MTIGTPSVDLPELYKVLGIEAPQRPVDKLVITVTSDAVTIEASGKVEHSSYWPSAVVMEVAIDGKKLADDICKRIIARPLNAAPIYGADA